MKSLVVYFYVDTVTNEHEADLYNDNFQGVTNIERWNSPEITSIHIKYAVGKKAVDELYEYYNEWIKRENK